MRKKKFLLTAAVLMLTLLFSTVGAFAADGSVDWERGVITAKGYGVPNTEKFRNPVQARLSAREAAKASAYAELLATLQGINVEATTTVENLMLENQTINTSVQGLVRNAQIVDQYWEEGAYCVVMQMPMYGSKSVATAVLPRTTVKEPIPAPVPNVQPSPPTTITTTTTTTTTIPSVPSTKPSSSGAYGGYTGVIIDCRGMNLNPVMSPVIRNDQGSPIYGYKNLNPDLIIEIGMASYASDMRSAAAQRAGSNPLVFKAVRLEEHNAYPVLTTADANRLLIENNASGFLEKLNVVFLR